MNELQRMKELAEILGKASRLYYQESTEMMSNREYDSLYDELLELERKTGTVLANSPTQKVGYEIVSELPKKAHPKPMLSLNKTKSADDLSAFLGDKIGLLSWKMDGLTVVLTYDNGTLSEALTRGNGEIGEIITANAKTFVNVPVNIPFKKHLVLRGEALISYADFDEINASISEAEEKYKNPRNLCSGSVRQLSSAVTAARHVRFHAFALVEAEDMSFALRREEMAFLDSLGFETVFYRAVDKDSVYGAVKAFSEEVKTNPLPSDGLVLLLDDIAYGNALGRTAKFPRNAIAFKWADEMEMTRMIDVEWSASRTGLINPVAIFEPVELEGTEVRRASVHNLTILEDLALGYGDEVAVYKANMIIPQIERNDTKSGTIKPPSFCPVCGAATEIHEQNGVKTLLCPNPDCPAKQIKSFDLFVSRDALNIDGLSESTLEKLIDVGIIHRFADLFSLEKHKDEIIALEGFGEKKWQNLCEAAEKARHTTLPRLIIALGIGNVGPATAKLICRHFSNDPDRVISATAEELTEIETIGGVIAESFTAYFADPVNLACFNELLGILDLEQEAESGKEQTMEGLGVVITGSLNHFANRDELKALIEERGGKVIGSVSAKTAFLINNDVNSSSTKNKAARKLGIPIISEEEAMEKFGLEATL